MYPTTQKLKKKRFMLKTENIKEVIGIQMTFQLEFKSQKVYLLQNITAADSPILNRY